MHVTEKVEHSAHDTLKNSPNALMDVYDDTSSRIERSADSRHGVHRFASQPQDTSQDKIDRTTFESSPLTEHTKHELNITALQKQQLSDLLETYRRRHSNYLDLQSANSVQRMSIFNRVSNLALNVERLQETANKLVSKANRSLTDAPMNKPKSQLRKLRDTMQLDTNAVGGQLQAWQVQLEDLREQDRRLEHAEAAFDNVARAMSTFLRNLLPVDNTEDKDDGSQVSLAPSSAYRSVRSDTLATPPVPELEQYYKTASDLRIMQERLAYLETERQEQWGRRVMLEDQDQVLEQSHDEFLEVWEKRLHEAEVNVDEAKAASEEARRACDAAGITIPDWGEASSVDDESKLDNLRFPLDGRISPLKVQPSLRVFEDLVSEPLMHDHGSSLSTPSASDQLITERVSHWIDTTTQDVDPVLPDALEASTVSSPENFGGVSHYACPHSNRGPAARSTISPTLPHPATIPTIATASPRTARSVGAKDAPELDRTVWETPVRGVSGPGPPA